MSFIKSGLDNVVTLTGDSNNLNGFVSTVTGFSNFFKELPKFLQMLPEEFHQHAPEFITKDLPNVCVKHINPMFEPIKSFLSYFDYASTIKSVTDPSFADKKWHQKGNTIAKLVQGTIDTVVLIPEKLQWFDVAGTLSNATGSFSSFLSGALSLNGFTIVGRTAGAVASVFNLVTQSQEISNNNKKIEDLKGRVTLLKDLNVAFENNDVRRIDTLAQDVFFQQDKSAELVNAYKEYVKLFDQIKAIETNIDALNKGEDREAVEQAVRKQEEAHAKLEDLKEQIRRLHYFWGRIHPGLLDRADKQFAGELFKSEVQELLNAQPSIEATLANPQGLSEDALRELRLRLLSDQSRQNLNALLSDNTIVDSATFGDRFDAIYNEHLKNTRLDGLQSIMDKVMLAYNKLGLERMAPQLRNNEMQEKAFKHIMAYEIDKSQIDIRAAESQKTKSWITIAMEVTKLALTALLLIKPIAALAAVTLSAGLLAGVSVAIFSVGLVLTIIGLTRMIHGLYWLDPKKQPQAHTHIGNLIATEV